MKQIEDVINQMKLINKTTPQARNYQCDKCKSIYCHNKKIWYVCRKEVSKNEFKDISKKGKKEE